MKGWIVDFAHSIVEGILDIIDGFAGVSAKSYLVTATAVALFTLFIAIGPHL